MNVVWGETAGVEGQICLLYPILFVLQAFKAYLGLLLLKTAMVRVVFEWQSPGGYMWNPSNNNGGGEVHKHIQSETEKEKRSMQEMMSVIKRLNTRVSGPTI